MAVALVTGCSTGIGYATALQLARDGYEVVATMRNPSACDLEAVAKEQALAIEIAALDVDNDEFVSDVMARMLAAKGGIDVLVNNAGLGGSGGVVEETDLAAFRQIMETNYFGALRCTKAVLPSMRERGSGTIVNVTSQAGQIAFPAMAPYCASKWALEAASEALAVEVAPFGIRVAIIEPGAIMTGIWGKTDLTPPTGPYKKIRNRLGATVIADVSRASSAEEVAACIAEAIATDQPKLRWLPGRGAERNVSQRKGWSDEEYIALWNMEDNAQFMRTILGADAE
jgi:NAD(P)-dependent dehydrogenase (short-subunit alcohol dehydrogenase family)